MLTTEVKVFAKPKVIDKIGKFLCVTLIASIIPVLIVMISVFLFTIPMLSIASSNSLAIIFLMCIFMVVTIFLDILLMSPITQGVLRCYDSMQKTGDFKISTVFTGFSSVKNIMISVKHSFVNYILIIVPTIIVALAGVFILATPIYIIEHLNFQIDNIIIPIFVFASLIIMIIFGLWILTIYFKSYAVYFYIFDELDENQDTKISIIQKYKQAFKDFKGYNLEIIYFVFSFILWNLVSAIPLIGAIVIILFVDPYRTLSYTALVSRIRQKDNIDSCNNVEGVARCSEENTIATQADLDEINHKIEVLNNKDEHKD